jgi:hypothetical protein
MGGGELFQPIEIVLSRRVATSAPHMQILPPETVRLFILQNKFIKVCKVLTVEGLSARAAALD